MKKLNLTICIELLQMYVRLNRSCINLIFAACFFCFVPLQLSRADTAVGQGWNLLGNGMTNAITISSSTALTNATQIASVWKWNASTRRWAFYTPQISDGGASYAAAKGFDTLSSINAGEGFWVNASQPFTLPTSTGSLYLSSLLQPNKSGALLLGWNLISVGNTISPKQLNMDLSLNPPAPGTVPENIVSLWSWDNAQAKWYFYAPILDGQGGSILKDYATTKGYLDYATTGKNLTLGTGFWVSNPTPPVSSTGSTSTVSSTTTTTQWQPISVSQITGTVAVGAAMSNTAVNIRCVNVNNSAVNVTTSTTTDYLGKYTAYISNAAYPCMLRATNTDDGTYIHSFLDQGNISNITPHTELIAANVLLASPTAAFDYFDQVRTKITSANIQQGILALSTATSSIIGAELSTVVDPLKTNFKAGREDKAGDSYDKKLDALMLAVSNANLKFSDVVTNFASGSLGSVSFNASTLGNSAKASSTCPYARNGKYYVIGFDGSGIYDYASNKFFALDFDYVNNTITGTTGEGYVVNATLSPYLDTKGAVVPCKFYVVDVGGSSGNETTMFVSASSVAMINKASNPSLSVVKDVNGNCTANCENGKISLAFPVKKFSLNEVVGKTMHSFSGRSSFNSSTNKYNYRMYLNEFSFDANGENIAVNCFVDQSINKVPDCANGGASGSGILFVNSDGTTIGKDKTTGVMFAAGFSYKYKDEIALINSRRDASGAIVGISISYYGGSPKPYNFGYALKLHGNTLSTNNSYYQVYNVTTSKIEPINFFEYNGSTLVEALTLENDVNPSSIGYSNIRYINYPANGFIFYPGQAQQKAAATIPGTSLGTVVRRAGLYLVTRGHWSYGVTSDIGAVYSILPSTDSNYNFTYTYQQITFGVDEPAQ